MKTITKSLSLEKFLIELSLVAEYFEWHCGDFNYIRAKHKNGRSYCPITAVALVNLGIHIRLNQWREAARLLGLNPGEASDIVTASDGCGGDRMELYKKIKESVYVN